jgi:hypothetical protein
VTVDENSKLRTIIESPFGKNPDGTRCDRETLRRNKHYLLRCIDDSIKRGEAPFASHLIYPMLLDDLRSDERETGILAGLAWGAVAQRVAVYGDYGITPGMAAGISRHNENGIEVVPRSIGKNP